MKIKKERLLLDRDSLEKKNSEIKNLAGKNLILELQKLELKNDAPP